jgi:hypothetical protein
MELVQFTGALDDGGQGLAPLEKTQTWREDLRQGSQDELKRARTLSSAVRTEPRLTPASEEVEEQFLDILAEMGQAPGQPERASIVDSIQQRLQPKLPESDEPRSFVHDIDDIVQRRIQLIPALQGRGLHVQPGPGGKVLFQFEGQEYESVDGVPNLTARQLIQDAIREWEETM